MSQMAEGQKRTYLITGGHKHYCQIVTALHYTGKIQQEIDRIYDKIESELIDWGQTVGN